MKKFFFYILTMVTGGSHNSSGCILSNVNSWAFGSPGEQTSQSWRGPFGFGFGIYRKYMKYDKKYR